MYGLRGQGQEVPEHVRVLAVGGRVPLLGVYKVRELYRIPYEEDGGVVSHEVIVPLFRVEFDREPPGVSLRVRRSLLPSHSGKAYHHLCAFAHFGEEFRLRVAG